MEATAIVIPQAAPPVSKGASKADSREPGKFEALYKDLSAENSSAKPTRAEHSDTVKPTAAGEGSEKANNANKAEKGEKAGNPEGAEKVEKAEKTEKAEKAKKAEEAQTTESGKGEDPEASSGIALVATLLTSPTSPTSSPVLTPLVAGPVSQNAPAAQTSPQASGEATVAVSKLTELVAVAPTELNIRQLEVERTPSAEETPRAVQATTQTGQNAPSVQGPQTFQASLGSQASQVTQASQGGGTSGSLASQEQAALTSSSPRVPEKAAESGASSGQSATAQPATLVAGTAEKPVSNGQKPEPMPKAENGSIPMQPTAQKSTSQHFEDSSAKEEQGKEAKTTKVAVADPKAFKEAVPEARAERAEFEDPKAKDDKDIRDIKGSKEVVGASFEGKAAPTGEVRSTEKAQEPVAAQVVRQAHEAVKSGKTEVRIKLDPENLGGITLRVVSKNGVVSANIVTESPQTKEIIESQLAGLKTQFADQGIRFDRLEINARQETTFDFSGQQQRQPFQEEGRRQAHHRAYVEETPTTSSDEPQSEGAVDFRA